MGLPMGLRIDLFFVYPMNLQGILLRVRYQMGVFPPFLLLPGFFQAL
jgi:hypothetical protein